MVDESTWIICFALDWDPREQLPPVPAIAPGAQGYQSDEERLQRASNHWRGAATIYLACIESLLTAIRPSQHIVLRLFNDSIPIDAWTSLTDYREISPLASTDNQPFHADPIEFTEEQQRRWALVCCALCVPDDCREDLRAQRVIKLYNSGIARALNNKPARRQKKPKDN